MNGLEIMMKAMGKIDFCSLAWHSSGVWVLVGTGPKGPDRYGQNGHALKKGLGKVQTESCRNGTGFLRCNKGVFVGKCTGGKEEDSNS